ncbi:hypothetical protein QE152_g25400 [Popillia japonica]|uniref:Uncharacterized protein n=1 Tax=Popillia japonica TaxID=7064 RepID=A0AAW1K0L9_POPJA
MDQGIIPCLKVVLRKELVYKIIHKLDSCDHTQIRTYLELQTAVTKFNTPCTLNGFLDIDNDVVVCETLTDEDIVDNVRVHLPNNNNNEMMTNRKKASLANLPLQEKHTQRVRFFVHIN